MIRTDDTSAESMYAVIHLGSCKCEKLANMSYRMFSL